MHLSNMWPSSLREILIVWYNVPIGTTGMVQVDQIKEDKINWHCKKRQESTIVCVCLCVFLRVQWYCRMTVLPVGIRSHDLMLLFLFDKWIKFWLDKLICGLYSFSISLHFLEISFYIIYLFNILKRYFINFFTQDF